MAVSYTVENVAGVGPFTLPSDIELLPFARVPLQSQIEVVLDGVTLAPVTDYTVNESLGTFTLVIPMVGTETLVFNRVTSSQTLATFVDGARLTADELNLAYRQNSLLIEELNEDLNSLVLNSNPGTLPSVGNAGYILSKVDGSTNTATWIDLDATAPIVNLQSSITGFQGQIDGITGTIGNPTDTNGPSIYGLINEVEIVAVDASSDVSALETQLYGTDINNPDAGTVLFRVNEAESAVTDKLDKVTTSAQSVASEITFDNSVTFDNEIKAASGRISTDAATRLAVPADLHPEVSTDLLNMAQYTQRTSPFRVSGFFEQNRDINNTVFYVYPLSDIGVDPLSLGSADSKYLYPEDFEDELSSDFTGYCAPGNGDQPQNGGRYGLYSPASAFRPLESDSNGSRVAGSLKGSISDYRADRGISEATPGSGNVFGIEGVRIFNPNTFSDTTNATVSKSGYQSLSGDGSLVDTTGSAAAHFSFPGFDKAPNMLYVPGSDNGGLVTVSMKFTSSYTIGNAFQALLMFTGMDEANESFGSAESVVPVAYNRRINPNVVDFTVSYTYDNSDGMPRYFAMAVSREGNAGDTIRSCDWSVSRGNTPDVGSYHDVDTSSSDYSWRRGTYDKYIQKLLVDNYVAQ